MKFFCFWVFIILFFFIVLEQTPIFTDVRNHFLDLGNEAIPNNISIRNKANFPLPVNFSNCKCLEFRREMLINMGSLFHFYGNETLLQFDHPKTIIYIPDLIKNVLK